MSKPKAASRLVASALVLAGTTLWLANAAYAQQVNGQGNDFDPVTRALSDKNPPAPAANGQPAAPQLTPEQQAELDRQKQLAEIQQKKEEAKKKADALRAAQKAKQDAAKEADMKRMAALKQIREDRMKEMKENHEQLEALLAEEKTARKAYQDSKKNSTGDQSQVDSDYRKAEKDRQKKIQELRHPKYKPMKLPSTTTTATTPASSTALPGTTTSGTGPTATTH